MPVKRRIAIAIRRSKGFVRRSANRCGIEISGDPYLARVVRLLGGLDVGVVIDVGANEGQFGRDLRAMGYTGRIISVEPLTGPFLRLAGAARRDPAWTTVHAAAADSLGELTIHVAGNSVSSSPLGMLPAHSSADPQSVYIADEEVTATTVDALVRAHHVDPAKALLKIDVQGFEASVLAGATENLAGFAAVQLELSLVHLYEGQVLMPELVDRLAGLGFELWILMPEFSDRATGRTLQCDGVFVRTDLLRSLAAAP